MLWSWPLILKMNILSFVEASSCVGSAEELPPHANPLVEVDTILQVDGQ